MIRRWMLASALGFSLAAFPAAGQGPSPYGGPDKNEPPGTIPSPPAEYPPLGPGALLGEEGFEAAHGDSAAHPAAHEGSMIDILGGRASAYLSLPRKLEPPVPAVILIHEWWGLNDHMKYWADRLAQDGYAALAVDLYGGRVTNDPVVADSLAHGVEEKRALALIEAARSVFAADPRIRADRIGCIGWSLGGAWALRYAMTYPGLAAVVIFYGEPVTEPALLRPVRAPLLAFFGDRDRSIPKQTVGAFEKALRDAGVDAQVMLLDAGHSFADPSVGSYDAEAAGAAWARLRPFLAEHLKKRA